jgi:hypothetical protein
MREKYVKIIKGGFMANLSNIYHVNENLRGIAKTGHCRPTIAELWDPDIEYDYPWCTFQPIYDNLDNIIYTEADELILVPGIEV